MYAKQLYLADSLDPTSKQMKFNTIDCPVKGRNLTAVRTLQKVPGSFFIPDQYFEKIKFFGLEGSSVTLLGMVKYDSQND
jgi:hypothetical protein